MPVEATPISSPGDYGTREGMELKVGSRNLDLYANYERGSLEATATQNAITAAIDAALAEVNAVMRLEWLKWQTAAYVPLGYSTSTELAVLNRGADYGAIAVIGNAYAKANAMEENLPWQIAEARRLWELFLADLSTGAILKEYYEDEADEADSGILEIQSGLGPVAKHACRCPEPYDADLYDCA